MGKEYINTTNMVDPWSERDDLFKFRKLTSLKFCVHFFKIRKCPEPLRKDGKLLSINTLQDWWL